jgi:hypothetical protein
VVGGRSSLISPALWATDPNGGHGPENSWRNSPRRTYLASPSRSSRFPKALCLKRGYHWRVAKLLIIAFALGLASLDVTGALAAVGALGAGARVRALMAFGCFSILGTVAFGTALSLIVGPRIAGLDWGMLLPHDPTEDRVAASVNVIVGLGLLAWGIMRTRRPAARPPKPSVPRGLGLISLAGAGVLFALAAIFDPTFVSLVVIAGRAELFWPVVAAHSTWTLVSHTPLVFVLALVASGDHERVVSWFQSWWARARPVVVHLVTSVVLLVGAFLLLDAAWWYVTGEFLIPG